MFQGEVMICEICEKQIKSDPNIESGWTYIGQPGEGFYVCNDHLGNEKWTKQQHREAWMAVMIFLVRKHPNWKPWK